MIFTKEDGSQEERELNNLFSMVVITFEIWENQTPIIQTLKTYTENSWKLVSTAPLALSPRTNGSGIFMTRYMLYK